MDEDMLVNLVGAIAEKNGVSDHQIAKRLGLSMSQLNRALLVLASPEAEGGLALVEARQDDKRRTLWLTDKGHALINESMP
ncbi:hypothetical protein [Amantichitinum ursilacus]|nr:hypothetical protein [Amantichitinum ursilacus]